MHEYDRVRICFHRMTFGLTSKYSIFCYDKLQTDCLTRYKNIHWMGYSIAMKWKRVNEKNEWKFNLWNINKRQVFTMLRPQRMLNRNKRSLPCLSRATVARLHFCKYFERCSLLFTSRRHFPSIQVKGRKKMSCFCFQVFFLFSNATCIHTVNICSH